MRRLIGHSRRDTSGVAAVEFGLILPLLLLLYLGTGGLIQAISASRSATILSRTLADLVSQQPANTAMTDAVMSDIFNSAAAVMAPFPTTNLKMTLSNVEFVANSAATNSNQFDAKTRWTSSFSSGTLRPCPNNPMLTPASNTADPSPTTMPLGLYAAGFLIVADVTYTYTPTIGRFTWANANGAANSVTSFTMKRTTYMRPRQTDNIRYGSTQSSVSAGTTQICPYASPQVA